MNYLKKITIYLNIKNILELQELLHTYKNEVIHIYKINVHFCGLNDIYEGIVWINVLLLPTLCAIIVRHLIIILIYLGDDTVLNI